MVGVGHTLWNDVEARVGACDVTEEAREALLRKAGTEGKETSSDYSVKSKGLDGDGLVELRGSAAETIATVTLERLGCLAGWWADEVPGREGLLRTQAGKLLASSIREAPRREPARRKTMQAAWRPGEWETAAEAAEEEMEEEAAEVGDEEPFDTSSPTAWLEGVNEAEREAMGATKVEEHRRLAASARIVGFAKGDDMTIKEVTRRFRTLAKHLHPDRHHRDAEETATATQSMQLLYEAVNFLTPRVMHAAVAAPARLQPAPPPPAKGDAAAAEVTPPPIYAHPTPRAVRQMPPALRKWIWRHLMGESAAAGEALQSPLTATHGIFPKPPHMHIEYVRGSERKFWGFEVDKPSTEGWETEPWPHDMLVTIEDCEEGDLDRVAAKARATRAVGRRVVLVVATRRKRQELETLGGRSVMITHVRPRSAHSRLGRNRSWAHIFWRSRGVGCGCEV